MSTRIHQLIDIPEHLFPDIVRSYYRDGAIKVIPRPMPDGTWVVIAEFAEEKPESVTAHTTAR